MEKNYIISQLLQNVQVYSALLSNVPNNLQLWRQRPEKWCLLEIVCHLYDEEREDFRARVKQVLEDPGKPLPPIDPVGWVTERNYKGQDYEFVLQNFLAERESSISWLEKLQDVNWQNVHLHPTLGPMTAYQFLANWLAHDHLHIRQITKLKFDHLAHVSGQDISYAGQW